MKYFDLLYVSRQNITGPSNIKNVTFSFEAQIDGTRKRYFRKKILRRKLPLCTRKAIQSNETDFVVCASDGNTFTNRSELCENLRANRSLSVVHPGECGNCTTENVCLSGLLPKRYVRPRKAFRLLRKFLGKKLNISGGNKTNETNAFNIRFNNSTCQKLIAKCEAFRDNSTIITGNWNLLIFFF